MVKSRGRVTKEHDLNYFRLAQRCTPENSSDNEFASQGIEKRQGEYTVRH